MGKIEIMTSKERMMTALTGGTPDRVPAAPDISNMVPCRLTRKPFWDIYVNENPPLWKAYHEAVKYFGIDGWFGYGNVGLKTKHHIETETKILSKSEDRYEVLKIHHTPEGDLREVMVSTKDNPPVYVEKMVKDFKKDFNKYKYFFGELTGYDNSALKEMQKAFGEGAIVCDFIAPPGFQIYVDHFDDGARGAIYAYYDYPDLFAELVEMHEKYCLRKLEMYIDAGIECIFTSGSGSITLQSPELWRKLTFHSVKRIAKICKEAGVVSGVHSCGKERYIVEACANETDINFINPLEIPPMGDCALAECKQNFGDKIALMGNLHTTNVMLMGSRELVRLESLRAILDAGIGGGFVLSSGDQCGRDTPDENIFEMVKVAKEFGKYPLDVGRIQDEIKRLEKKL